MPSSVDDIDIAALWSAVAGAKWRLVIAVLLVGAASFLVLSMVTPRYASKAQILIENDESAFTRPRGAQGVVDTARIDREAVESQVHVLGSPDLAEKVASKLRLRGVPELNSALMPESVLGQAIRVLGVFGPSRTVTPKERVLEAFRKRLLVYSIKGSRVIAIEFSSRDPERAARIANTLAETYLEWQRSEQLKTNRGASKWLGARIATLRVGMEKAETRVEKFRASKGLMTGQNNVTLSTQQLSELQSQLSIARAARSEAEARAKLIGSMLQRGDIEASPDVLKSVFIQRLLEQKVRVKRQIAELSATLLAAHPRIRQLRADLAGLRRQIGTAAGKVVRSLENEAKIARAREASLEASLDGLKGQATGSSGALARLRVFEREAKSKRELYETFLARHGEASARQNRFAVPSYASIIQTARPASEPAFPKKGPLSVLAMVATLLVGLALIVTRELLRGAVRVAPRPELHS